MSARRSIPRKAVDSLALLLVGFCAASVTSMLFRVDSWFDGILSTIFAVGFDLWFLALVQEVVFLWTGRWRSVRTILRRARPASPSPE